MPRSKPPSTLSVARDPDPDLELDDELDEQPRARRLARSQRLLHCLECFAELEEGTEIHVERIGGGAGVARGAVGCFVADGPIAFPEDLVARYGPGEYRLVALDPEERAVLWQADTPLLLGDAPSSSSGPDPQKPVRSEDSLMLAMIQQQTQLMTGLFSALSSTGNVRAKAESDIASANLKYAERLQSEMLQFIGNQKQAKPFGDLDQVFKLLDTLETRGLIGGSDGEGSSEAEMVTQIAQQVGPLVTGAVQQWFQLRREQMAIDAAGRGILIETNEVAASNPPPASGPPSDERGG